MKAKSRPAMLFTVFVEARQTLRINKQILWQHIHTHTRNLKKNWKINKEAKKHWTTHRHTHTHSSYCPPCMRSVNDISSVSVSSLYALHSFYPILFLISNQNNVHYRLHSIQFTQNLFLYVESLPVCLSENGNEETVSSAVACRSRRLSCSSCLLHNLCSLFTFQLSCAKS